MIESSIQRCVHLIRVIQEHVHFCRTYASFENKLKSGINLNPTDYILPNEVILALLLRWKRKNVKIDLNQICAMINVVLDAKNQSLKLCSADGKDMVSNNLSFASIFLLKYLGIICYD